MRPWRRVATTVVTVALLVLGLAVAVVLEWVPGLMTPGGAMHDMSMPIASSWSVPDTFTGRRWPGGGLEVEQPGAGDWPSWWARVDFGAKPAGGVMGLGWTDRSMQLCRRGSFSSERVG